MRKNLFVFIVIYLIISFFSEQKANLFLAVAAILFIPTLLILRTVLKGYLYRSAIKRVKKRFIAGENVICNKNCLVKFYPDEKIYVSDIEGDNPRDLYAFTFSKYETQNINKCWSDICNFFDDYTYLKMLLTYCESFYTEGKINTELIKKYTAEDIENIKQPSQQPPELTENNFDTIDINSASAQEISSLPGLNIIMAKKAVNYRNKYGEFKSEADFFKAAGIKDFFKPAISKIINIKKCVNKPSEINDDGGRIVDL